VHLALASSAFLLDLFYDSEQVGFSLSDAELWNDMSPGNNTVAVTHGVVFRNGFHIRSLVCDLATKT